MIDHDPSVAFKVNVYAENTLNGKEPRLGGALRDKAVWVDEATCIGCRYCSHVAVNTFVIEPSFGRSRVIRQDGDKTETIQEAIDTCPVDCIHWVPFEELDALRAQLEDMDLQPLGLPPKTIRRFKPRST